MKELIAQGGTLMYFIIGLSVVGLAVVLERIYYFFTVERGDYEKLKDQILEFIDRGDIKGAKTICLSHDNSVAKVLEGILESYEKCNGDRVKLEEKVREVALAQIPNLERFMWLLGITAHVSPLLGLFGTVTGMITAFNVIADKGVGDPKMLAVGISQALITTAAGLAVAIPALIVYNYFNKKIDVIINEMERASTEFLNELDK